MYACPKCGIVKVYGMTETVRRYLLYNDKDEAIGSTEDMTMYSGSVKRCIKCDSKVRFLEDRGRGKVNASEANLI